MGLSAQPHPQPPMSIPSLSLHLKPLSHRHLRHLLPLSSSYPHVLTGTIRSPHLILSLFLCLYLLSLLSLLSNCDSFHRAILICRWFWFAEGRFFIRFSPLPSLLSLLSLRAYIDPYARMSRTPRSPVHQL